MSIARMDFAEAWENRRIVDFFGVSANFISLDDLIKSKKLAGRPQDLVDVENLLLAKKLKES